MSAMLCHLGFRIYSSDEPVRLANSRPCSHEYCMPLAVRPIATGVRGHARIATAAGLHSAARMPVEPSAFRYAMMRGELLGTLNPNIPSTRADDGPQRGGQAHARVRPAVLSRRRCCCSPSAVTMAAWRTACSCNGPPSAAFAWTTWPPRPRRWRRFAPDTDAQFNFHGRGEPAVPLSTEMVIVLDEGRSIAQASNESYVGTEHALGGWRSRASARPRCCAATASRQHDDQPAGRPGADQARSPARTWSRRPRSGEGQAGLRAGRT